MSWFKGIFGSCMEGRQSDKMDWVEIEYRKYYGDEKRADFKENREEFIDILSRSSTPVVLERDSAGPCSPAPTVCSPVPSLYLCSTTGESQLSYRPRKELPTAPAQVDVAPCPIKSVKQLVATYEHSLSHSPAPIMDLQYQGPSFVILEKPTIGKPKVVAEELRRYQHMKRKARFDQRARQENGMKDPICPGRGGSGRFRSPSYPPSFMLTSPYRSLQ